MSVHMYEVPGLQNVHGDFDRAWQRSILQIAVVLM